MHLVITITCFFVRFDSYLILRYLLYFTWFNTTYCSRSNNSIFIDDYQFVFCVFIADPVFSEEGNKQNDPELEFQTTKRAKMLKNGSKMYRFKFAKIILLQLLLCGFCEERWRFKRNKSNKMFGKGHWNYYFILYNAFYWLFYWIFFILIDFIDIIIYTDTFTFLNLIWQH